MYVVSAGSAGSVSTTVTGATTDVPFANTVRTKSLTARPSL